MHLKRLWGPPPAALPAALLALLLAAPAAARKGEAPADGAPEGQSEAEVVAQVKTTYDDLAGNSSPFVRAVVFEGRVALEDPVERAKAIEQGLTDAHWPIVAQALGLALEGSGRKDKAQQEAALATLDKLLQSGEAADRERGLAALDERFKGKARLERLKAAAKLGAPDARAAARAALRAEGGATAWAVITAGLAEPPADREHTEALEALAGFSDPVALKWARQHLHHAEPLGGLARGILARLEGKAVRSLDKDLLKAFDKAKGEFEQRVQLAAVLAARGQVKPVERTCQAALKYREAPIRVMGWRCLAGSRDLAILGAVQERILATEDPDESDAAFAWLEAWAKQKGEPKVYELLQAAARSDRRPVRMRAMAALTSLRHRPSVALFEGAMSEGQTEVREAASKGLAAVAEPGDEARLGGFLRKEPVPEVKLALIEGLARIGTPETIDILQFVITAPQRDLKLAAVKAVAATGLPKAATLLSLLKSDPDLDVRFLAWHSLLRLQGATAERELPAAIPWLRPDQVEALGADPKISLDALELIARRGGDALRPFAVSALEARGEAAATRLLALSEHPDPGTASAALRALAGLRRQESVPTYRKRLDSKHGPVRAAAFAALGEYAPRAVLDAALSGLGDKDPLARAEAARAAVKLVRRADAE